MIGDAQPGDEEWTPRGMAGAGFLDHAVVEVLVAVSPGVGEDGFGEVLLLDEALEAIGEGEAPQAVEHAAARIDEGGGIAVTGERGGECLAAMRLWPRHEAVAGQRREGREHALDAADGAIPIGKEAGEKQALAARDGVEPGGEAFLGGDIIDRAPELGTEALLEENDDIQPPPRGIAGDVPLEGEGVRAPDSARRVEQRAGMCKGLLARESGEELRVIQLAGPQGDGAAGHAVGAEFIEHALAARLEIHKRRTPHQRRGRAEPRARSGEPHPARGPHPAGCGPSHRRRAEHTRGDDDFPGIHLGDVRAHLRPIVQVIDRNRVVARRVFPEEKELPEQGEDRRHPEKPGRAREDRAMPARLHPPARQSRAPQREREKEHRCDGGIEEESRRKHPRPHRGADARQHPLRQTLRRAVRRKFHRQRQPQNRGERDINARLRNDMEQSETGSLFQQGDIGHRCEHKGRCG